MGSRGLLIGCGAEEHRPNEPRRPVAMRDEGLLLLKHIYGLSDEGVCERWVHDPHFQFFTGEEFFQHIFPHERSDLSHWRKRLGDKLELLLAESLRVAHEAGAQPAPQAGHGRHHGATEGHHLSDRCQAAARGDPWTEPPREEARGQTAAVLFSRSLVAKTAAMMVGRYAHAKQFKRQLRILRNRLAWPGRADPLATAAPAWLEALFLPRPGGGVHRQRQGRRALRVRRQGLHRYQ